MRCTIFCVAQASILLVEDNSDEEMLILRAALGSGLTCQIVVAHTTNEALDLLLGYRSGQQERPSPKVIVTDLRVGPHGGAQFVSCVRAQPEHAAVPIVVLSGLATDEQIEDLYRRGANSFLDKPIDYEAFSELVVRAIRYWGWLNTTAPEGSALPSFPYSLG